MLSFFERQGGSIVLSADDLRQISFKNSELDFFIGKFILEENEKRSPLMDYIVELVKGYFVTTALYLQAENLDVTYASFSNVIFYLDTRLLLALLGFKSSQENESVQEMVKSLQRNGAKLACFSCIDMRSEQSVWNAYNLVLPALPPYDDDGLSLALKEHFNWSMPTYVHVPILNSNTTTPDVQILDTYSNEICQALGTQYVPTELVSFARKLLNIIGNMRTVLTRSAGADMQLVLHMLDSIDANLSVLRGMDYDTFIATQREKLKGSEIFFKDTFDQVAQHLKPIYKKICGYDSNSVSIEDMIRKYHWGIWGEFGQTPRLGCFCATEEDKRWIMDWGKSNHVLFWIKENLSGDKIIEDLQKIAETTKIDIASFWPPQFAEMAADESWRKDNLDKIESPVFVKNLGGECTFICAGKGLTKREESLAAAFCKR